MMLDGEATADDLFRVFELGISVGREEGKKMEQRPTPILAGENAARFLRSMNNGPIIDEQIKYLDECISFLKDKFRESEVDKMGNRIEMTGTRGSITSNVDTSGYLKTCAQDKCSRCNRGVPLLSNGLCDRCDDVVFGAKPKENPRRRKIPTG